jgi:hypothetical protein
MTTKEYEKIEVLVNRQGLTLEDLFILQAVKEEEY